MIEIRLLMGDVSPPSLCKTVRDDRKLLYPNLCFIFYRFMFAS